MSRRNRVAAAAIAAALALAGSGCGSGAAVTYDRSNLDEDTLLVYVGDGGHREILEYVVENILPDSVKVALVDADAESNGKVAAGDGDLSYYQHIPAFEADVAENSYDNLSTVSKVHVIPYALYSSKWADVEDTESWVNVGLVDDEVVGESLPHGSRVVMP